MLHINDAIPPRFELIDNDACEFDAATPTRRTLRSDPGRHCTLRGVHG